MVIIKVKCKPPYQVQSSLCLKCVFETRMFATLSLHASLFFPWTLDMFHLNTETHNEGKTTKAI